MEGSQNTFSLFCILQPQGLQICSSTLLLKYFLEYVQGGEGGMSPKRMTVRFHWLRLSVIIQLFLLEKEMVNFPGMGLK